MGPVREPICYGLTIPTMIPKPKPDCPFANSGAASSRRSDPYRIYLILAPGFFPIFFSSSS